MAAARSVAVLVLAALLPVIAAQQLYLQLGADVPASAANRAAYLLETSWGKDIVILDPMDNTTAFANGSLIISVGDTALSPLLVNPDELGSLPAEGFIVRTSVNTFPDSTFVAANGNVIGTPSYRYGNIGQAFALYAILQEMGFGFLHPLEPIIPSPLLFPFESFELTESASWHYRNWHLHTMHPLELTDLLNGFNISHNGYEETFDDLLVDWDLFLEWSLANRINHVEWVLLLGPEWREWGQSEERKQRLSTIFDHCHEFGIVCGFDVPIALVQQNSWTMIGRPDPEDETYDPIVTMKSNIDWWVSAGADFLTTESGFSEFTQGSCTDMLNWMDTATIYLGDVYNKSLHIKVHVSTGQFCEEYLDPDTGEPINFNFLPIFADPRLGILPHTVQVYTYDEPAPTYGNSDFNHIFDFMFREMARGDREVVFYPETSYWVNYDAQVPLFLPIYAYNRFLDLRLVRRKEKELNAHMTGQLTFESGWEWTYWLQNVVTARAQWDIIDEIEDDLEAYEEMLRRVFKPFGAAANDLASWIVSYSVLQKELLIYGDVTGTPPADVEKLNGIAYLEGWDTFADIGMLFESFLRTQPDRVNPLDFRTLDIVTPNYTSLVKPLLGAMEERFDALNGQLDAIAPLVDPVAAGYMAEIEHAARSLYTRASFLHAVYDYASTHADGPSNGRRERLQHAQAMIQSITAIVREREESYRVPLERIAGWRPNPTVYRYTYLWHVKSLYYWYRDIDKAQALSVAAYSPCYMNVIDPAVVAFGDGQLQEVLEKIREWADERSPGNHFLIDCVTAPLEEPSYPLQQNNWWK